MPIIRPGDDFYLIYRRYMQWWGMPIDESESVQAVFKRVRFAK
jgi:hypothetical protein